MTLFINGKTYEAGELIAYVKKLQKENAELKADYEVLSCSVGNFDELQDKFEEEQRKNSGLSDNLFKAKEIILKLYNAGRDVLMCRAEEKAYDNLDEAINDRSIEQFLKEVEND